MRNDLFQLAEHLSASFAGDDRLIDAIRTLAEYGSIQDVEEFTRVVKAWAK